MEPKLLLLMYLEDDEACVERTLADQGVTTFSRLSMEGRTDGTSGGWYGVAPPYRSQLILAVMPAERADAVLRAVADCRGIQDPRHPIRAMQLAVEQSAFCQCNDPESESEK